MREELVHSVRDQNRSLRTMALVYTSDSARYLNEATHNQPAHAGQQVPTASNSAQMALPLPLPLPLPTNLLDSILQQRLRSSGGRRRALRIVACTAMVLETVRLRMRKAGCFCAIPSPQDATTSGVECHCVGARVSCVAQFRLQAELLLHRSGQWSETRGRMVRLSRNTWMRMSCRINVPATQRIFRALAVGRRMGLYILLRQSNVYDSQHSTIYRHQCPLH